jgi:dihydrofolate synthase / folylpolyglutamate synthase
LGEGIRVEYEPLPPRAKITTPRRPYPWTPLALMGRHQAANAALAVATADRLVDAGLHVPASAVATGLATVVWPARVEIVGRSPVRVIDSAHNVPSAEALVATLAESVPVTGRKRCVFAVSSDKPFAEMLAVLSGYFDEFVFTRYTTNPRRVPPETLVPLVPSGRVVEPATAAWESAVEASGSDDLVCATGSVFLAGELWAVVSG